MNKYLVDTNIFLRILQKDNLKMFDACKKLFEKCEQGKIKLYTSNLVILELVWTLKNFYKEKKEQIVDEIFSILNFPNLDIEDKELLLETLMLWQHKNTDFSDVYNYVLAKKTNITNIYSYDKDFDQFDKKIRIEP